MVFQLLVFLRRRAEKRPACLHQIWPEHVEVFIYKKIFLFGTQGHVYMVVAIGVEAFHKAFCLRT